MTTHAELQAMLDVYFHEPALQLMRKLKIRGTKPRSRLGTPNFTCHCRLQSVFLAQSSWMNAEVDCEGY